MAKRRRQPHDEFWDEPKEPGYSGGGFAQHLGALPGGIIIFLVVGGIIWAIGWVWEKIEMLLK